MPSTLIHSIKSTLKLGSRSKKAKQDAPPAVAPLKLYETRSKGSLATNRTVSSLATILTAATVHDDRMEIDQDIGDGYDPAKRQDDSLRGGNATGVLGMPLSDPRTTLQRAVIEQLTEEKARISAELADARRASEEEKANMTRALERQRVDIQGLEAAIQELNTKYRKAVTDREGSEGELRRSVANAAKCNAQILGQAEDAIQGFRKDAERASREKNIALKEKALALRTAKDLETRLDELEAQLDTKNTLLAVRTKELKTAQCFMSTGDSLSVNDIAREVEELNEGIYQCAMIVTDYLLEARVAGDLALGDHEVRYQQSDEALGKLGRYFGEDIVQRLCADVLSGETLLLECLVQNILVKMCEGIFRRLWYGDAEADRLFREVWRGVSDKYDEAIARSWLAMTHSQLKRRRLDSSPVLEDLTALLDVLGLDRSSRHAAKISATLRTKVIDLTKQARRVKEMALEDVLSLTVEPFLVDGGASFDGMRMQNPYDGQGQSGQLVICSTGLGVTCGKRNSAWEVVMKPKVLLLSSLDMGLEEMPEEA